MPPVFAVDTSPEASALLIAKWRSMSFIEKAELVEAMCLEAESTHTAAPIESAPATPVNAAPTFAG
jgi:hypothetical protein